MQRLHGIRAVLFDIYGTLLISGAGDISLQTGTSNDAAFCESLVVCGVPPQATVGLTADLLKQTIAEHHAVSRIHGVEFPEVDIVAVWRDALSKIGAVGDFGVLPPVDVERLAVEYEVRVNPLWPMPGLLDCLSELRNRGMLLGIVSNAQSMTPELFPALLDQSLGELGFAEELLFFSYQHGEAKPGQRMFQAAKTALAGRGVQADQAVFVGNDALNDVWAAAQVGFRTILFAGDERSLRLRADDVRVAQCRPDAVVVDLVSIGGCLENPG